MNWWNRWFLTAVLSGGALVVLIPGKLYAQASAASGDPQAQNTDKKQDTSKARNPASDKFYKELATPYKKWLDEDVVYIITDEERQAFLQLADRTKSANNLSSSSGSAAIPIPIPPIIPYKEEHYRRIAYANEHFASGVPGWKTDRGRIYIMYGKPDRLDTHTQGENWDRPLTEGGGANSNVSPTKIGPTTIIEGIGENIELEFVDPTGTGEFQLTTTRPRRTP